MNESQNPIDMPYEETDFPNPIQIKIPKVFLEYVFPTLEANEVNEISEYATGHAFRSYIDPNSMQVIYVVRFHDWPDNTYNVNAGYCQWISTDEVDVESDQEVENLRGHDSSCDDEDSSDGESDFWEIQECLYTLDVDRDISDEDEDEDEDEDSASNHPQSSSTRGGSRSSGRASGHGGGRGGGRDGRESGQVKKKKAPPLGSIGDLYRDETWN
jgi:hypothetical protein